MFLYGVIGTLLAGFYGAAHDQITYSISPEYFTRVKFLQFHYADFGSPPRIFAAEIGFLASCWVGFFAAWFLARVTVPAFSKSTVRQHMLKGFGIIFGLTLAGGIVGFVWGALRIRSDLSAWQIVCEKLSVADVPHFVEVAFIHNGSYAGAILGFLIALAWIAWRTRRLRRGQTDIVARYR